MIVKITRFGLEGAPESNNDVYLCQDCTHDVTFGNDDKYEGYPIFYLTDEVEEGYTKCAVCERYEGEVEDDA